MWSNRKLLATVGLMQMFQDQCTACFDAVRLKLYISHLYDNLHIVSNLNLPNPSQRKLSASRRFLYPPPAFLKNLEQQGFGSDFVFQSQICYSPTCQASKQKIKPLRNRKCGCTDVTEHRKCNSSCLNAAFYNRFNLHEKLRGRAAALHISKVWICDVSLVWECVNVSAGMHLWY